MEDYGENRTSHVMSLCQRYIPSKPVFIFVAFVWKPQRKELDSLLFKGN